MLILSFWWLIPWNDLFFALCSFHSSLLLCYRRHKCDARCFQTAVNMLLGIQYAPECWPWSRCRFSGTLFTFVRWISKLLCNTFHNPAKRWAKQLFTNSWSIDSFLLNFNTSGIHSICPPGEEFSWSIQEILYWHISFVFRFWTFCVFLWKIRHLCSLFLRNSGYWIVFTGCCIPKVLWRDKNIRSVCSFRRLFHWPCWYKTAVQGLLRYDFGWWRMDSCLYHLWPTSHHLSKCVFCKHILFGMNWWQ